jgi:cytochrome b
MDIQQGSAGQARGGATRRLPVWDPWIRLVHWALVLLLPVSWWTAKTGRFELHILSGCAILTLVLFRLAWGLVGSETARFAQFLKGPPAALRHLGHLLRRDAPAGVGHNAAGGWMVLAMLLLVLGQAATGLMADDEMGAAGPLAGRVAPDWSAAATSLHLRLYWLILASVALHILAIIAYRLLLRRDLVKPMLTGWVEGEGLPAAAPRMGGAALALALLAASAALVAWIAAQAGG